MLLHQAPFVLSEKIKKFVHYLGAREVEGSIWLVGNLVTARLKKMAKIFRTIIASII